MSSVNYAITRVNTLVRIESILDKLNKERLYIKKCLNSPEIDIIFDKFYRWLPKMKDIKEMSYSSLRDLEHELNNYLPILYSELYKTLIETYKNVFKNLEVEINNSEIESDDYRKLMIDLYNLKDKVQILLSRRDIINGINEINSELDNIRNSLKIAIDRRKKLYQDIQNLIRENENILNNIKEKAKYETKSEIIKKAKDNLLKQAEETLGLKFESKDLIDILKFEEKKYNILKDINKKIDDLVERGSIYDHLKIQDKIISIDEVIKDMKLKSVNDQIKQDRELLYNEIYKLKDKILTLRIPEYITRTEKLLEKLENQPINILSMIKHQLEIFLAQAEKRKEEIMALKERLFPYKIYLSQSIMPEAKNLEEEIDELLKKDIFSQEEVEEIEDRVKKLKEQEEKIRKTIEEATDLKLIAKTFEDVFKELGYEPLSNINVNAEPVYIDTRWPEYKVKFLFNKRGQILVKFVRIVGSEDEKENITERQKAKDIEIAKEWCKDYKKWLERLRELNIYIEEGYRKEPEEAGVEIEVNENLISHSRRKEKLRQENPKKMFREEK
jgi:hypothetical protein